MTRLHSIVRIDPADLTACDLRGMAEHSHIEQVAYRALAAKPDGTPEAEALEVLHVPAAGRIGIAWGSGAQWADIDADEPITDLVTLYLTDGDAFAARA